MRGEEEIRNCSGERSGGGQAAIRSGKKLWATDTVLGLACEYDQYGDDTHAKVVGE